MNDPGLDEPISSDAKDVENQLHDEHDKREEEEQAFLDPSRWWFASTAFPLIAGTFGPMASAFSICALAVHWRVYIPPGKTENEGMSVDDPPWLIAINAAQLGLALTSNLFLLLNMARRVRFSVAQPITIIGWYISSFALTGLCACAAGPLELLPQAEYAFTQAYYYAIFSAGLYFIVATLMIITVWGASRGHYHKEFQLTMSQRTLMLQTISYFVYLLAGSAVYSHIEGWPYLDAVYWADFTLLTVGVGDFAPATHLGRSLLFPFAIGGIIILSLVIGSIRSLVLERGKVKMGARMVEKERQHILKMMERKNKDVILEPVAKTPRNISPLSMRPLQDQNPRPDMTERQRRQEEFELMRKIQEKAHRKRRWTSLVISGTVWFVLWFVGAAIFEQTEYVQSWSYFYALYFSYTSLLTIGYGDLYPVSSSGRAFFVFWSLLAVPSLTILISSMGDTIVKGIRDLTLWVGGFTVLPGEQGVKASLKKTASRVSRGRLFDSSIDTQETPPGFLGESTRRGSNISLTNNNPNNNPESAAQRLDDDTARMESSQAKKHQDEDVLPKAKHHYHYLLIEEISKVMQHIHSSPPRKYTFEEWAWYLRLVGEDESDADGHRRARKKVKPGEVEADAERWGKAKDRDNSKAELREWSWVGVRSPLMGEKDEAEWILERLTRTLKRELEGVKIEKEEAARKGRGRVGEVEDAQV